MSFIVGDHVIVTPQPQMYTVLVPVRYRCAYVMHVHAYAHFGMQGDSPH